MRPVALTSLIVCLAGCGSGTPAPATSTPPAKVAAAVPETALATLTLTDTAQKRLGIATGVVEHRSVARTRLLGGDVLPEGGAVSTVTAPFSGTLSTELAPPLVGGQVAGGQPVLALIPFSPAERDVRVEAERVVAEAEGQAEMMRQRVERATQLAVDGSGSRRAVEEATASAVTANAAVQAARARLALAAKGVTAGGAVIMRAPHAALLRTLHATPGQTVAAGAPLFELVRLDAVWVRVPVYAGELETLDTRAAVTVTGLAEAADARGLTAQPVAAPPAADPTTAAVDVFYRVANSGQRLRPGQRVSVRMPLRDAQDQLVAPRAALLTDSMGGTWVYHVLSGGQFARRRVDVSDVVGNFAVLRHGPPPGTRVVTAGAAELFGTEFGVGK